MTTQSQEMHFVRYCPYQSACQTRTAKGVREAVKKAVDTQDSVCNSLTLIVKNIFVYCLFWKTYMYNTVDPYDIQTCWDHPLFRIWFINKRLYKGVL